MTAETRTVAASPAPRVRSRNIPVHGHAAAALGRSAGKVRRASRKFAIPSGTFTRNIIRQPAPAMSSPPIDGPSVVPIADIVPRSPIALPMRPFGTVSPTTATVSAIMIAAPSPCTARAATSTGSVGAAPQSSEATVKSAIPARSSRRRPTRSPRRPAPTMSAVIAMRYAITTHCTARKEAPNASARVGSATLAMLVSSDGISMDSERPASAQRADGAGGAPGLP